MFPELELKEGWATVFLLLLMLLCVATAIRVAEWTSGLGILLPVVLVGGILGTVLAKIRVPNWLAHLLSLLAGATWVLYLTTGVLVNRLDLSFQAAVIELDGRLQTWVYTMFGQGTSSDNYIFLLLLSFLMWLMAYFCAWAIFRWQRVWWAIIVCGLALMINLSYGPSGLTGYLVAFLLFALLLIVRTSVAFYEQEWRMANVHYSSELVYGFLRVGFVISALAILLAWIAPEALASRPLQPFWEKVGDPWRRLQDQSYRMFQDLNYQSEPAFIYFDRSMKFGGPVQLPDTPVMDIEAYTGRYWRVMVFHEYAGDGWDNTDLDTILIDENSHRLASSGFQLRREVSQTVTLHQDLGAMGTIATAAQPLRSQLPLRALVSFVNLEGAPNQTHDISPLLAPLGDPSVLYSRLNLQAGDSYHVVSSLTRADAESLRQAGTDYPAWVVPRYLELPDSVPERVRDLAEEITMGQESAYDKAVAIERYLRKLPYNDFITGPAAGQDGVDYFLFEAREGYCDYYSSAMVVMLRSVGVPARYVRGYSQGSREEGVYHILESDGHAWPEVFFPAYGWIEFEPTAGEPILTRPRSRNGSPGDANIERYRSELERDLDERIDTEIDPSVFDTASPVKSVPFWQQVGRWVWLVLALVASSLLAFVLFTIRRRRRLEGLSVVERVYYDLVNWVHRLLRIEPLIHQTPNEYAGIVVQNVPQGRQAVERITSLYVQERFGAKPVPGTYAEVAWKQARPLLWRRWLEQRAGGIWRFWRRSDSSEESTKE